MSTTTQTQPPAPTSASASTLTNRKPSKPKIPPTITKTTSATALPPAIKTLTHSFLTDPLFTYVLNSVPPAHRPWAIHRVITLTLHLAHTNSGIIYEAHPSTSQEPHQSTSLIFPPHKSLDNVPLSASWTALRLGIVPLLWKAGFSPLKKFNTEYIIPVKAAKASIGLSGSTPYWYISHIGTLDSARGQGLASGIIRDLQAQAQKEGLPIWLEASSRGSRGVYAGCGFVDVDVRAEKDAGVDGEGEVGILMGRGVCDERGEKKESGEGVRFFPMVWWPEGYKK
ncbi:hypothetical protein B0J11DRAFT_505232 [Dendryphion nanum]|uniref:N-acetyltransferase domain-containing protein n=1 Tax=Dendryphion nanum TaxID=256645 RepID=A0A9P9E0F6_9PLEO|nr:hypothetical protein B0J11DRAFT_505232 [Dendryphion nanum]